MQSSSPEAGKDKEMASLLEPAEGNLALLTGDH